MKEVPFEVRRLVITEGMGHIKAWLNYRRVTQKELASMLNITQPAVSIMINRKKNLRATLEKVSIALDVPVEHLNFKR